jgi:hypothetical protein
VNSVLYTAGFSELFDTAHESPELDRVLDNMRRHMRTGRYDAERARHSVERYVVEPSAIALHKVKAATEPVTRPSPRTPKVMWFTRYPRDLRAEVARRIVRTWERELKAEGVVG